MITIVDYGLGNLGALVNMFKRINVDARVESDIAHIAKATKLVLPGVGAFDAAMLRINSISGLRQTLIEKVQIARIPLLGVCLGMQLLTDGSDEGVIPGLGLISGRVRRFTASQELKVPHMGWNVARASAHHPITLELGENCRYYFVHSYYVSVQDPAHSIMRTRYGIEFDSAIADQNIVGVQFHPEKSHNFGMKILQNFARM
jgi:glutamine amidotransferase